MKKPELLKDTSQKELYGTNWRTNEQEFEVVDSMEFLEKNYPEMTSEFKRIQLEQYKLFCNKQYVYGPDNISVGTQLQTLEEVILALTGLWFRMNDKITRLKTILLRNGANPSRESMIDSFLDLSNYGIMATIVKNGKWGR